MPAVRGAVAAAEGDALVAVEPPAEGHPAVAVVAAHVDTLTPASVTVGVSVSVGFSVGLSVGFSVRIGIGIAVGVGVGIRITVAVAVGVGIRIAVAITVAVGVSIAVATTVSIGIAVGVSIAVSGLGAGWGTTNERKRDEWEHCRDELHLHKPHGTSYRGENEAEKGPLRNHQERIWTQVVRLFPSQEWAGG